MEWDEIQHSVEIDESSHREAPTLKQRLINTLSALVMGLLFMSLFFLFFSPWLEWSLVEGIHDPESSFATINWIIATLNLLFLSACTLLGWFYGKGFVHLMEEGLGSILAALKRMRLWK